MQPQMRASSSSSSVLALWCACAAVAVLMLSAAPAPVHAAPPTGQVCATFVGSNNYGQTVSCNRTLNAGDQLVVSNCPQVVGSAASTYNSELVLTIALAASPESILATATYSNAPCAANSYSTSLNYLVPGNGVYTITARQTTSGNGGTVAHAVVNGVTAATNTSCANCAAIGGSWCAWDGSCTYWQLATAITAWRPAAYNVCPAGLTTTPISAGCSDQSACPAQTTCKACQAYG